MKQIKKYVKMFSPFNNRKDLPKSVFICKKMLGFFLLYFAAGILGEVVIVSGLTALGYDPLHGIMPEGKAGTLIPFYGFSAFLILTMLYCKFVEKRTIKSMGCNKQIFDYLVGAGLAIVLLVFIMGVGCITGSMFYLGIGKENDYFYLIALMVGLMIQSTAEEVMCRGYLMTSLLEKIPVPHAVFYSALAFAMPHFMTLFEGEISYIVVGTVNLFLISLVLSLLVLYRGNLWVACGLHSVWNFLLFGVCGLTLSGSETDMSGVFCFRIEKTDLLNGGVYGIEAGILTTAGLCVAVIVLLNKKAVRRVVKNPKKDSLQGGIDANGI